MLRAARGGREPAPPPPALVAPAAGVSVGDGCSVEAEPAPSVVAKPAEPALPSAIDPRPAPAPRPRSPREVPGAAVAGLLVTAGSDETAVPSPAAGRWACVRT